MNQIKKGLYYLVICTRTYGILPFYISGLLFPFVALKTINLSLQKNITSYEYSMKIDLFKKNDLIMNTRNAKDIIVSYDSINEKIIIKTI